MDRAARKFHDIIESSRFKKGIYAFITILLVLVNLIIILLELQWDFKIYYTAANDFRNGLTPYKDIYKDLSYVYHPYTLYIFVPFTFLPYSIASILFLFLKNIAFISILYLWIFKFIEEDNNSSLFLFFSTIAFNAAFFIDLIAGNIATFECFIIWGALYFLFREKFYYLFCILIIFVSLFKITPILLLFLLLFSKNNKKHLTLALSFAGFLLIFFLPAIYNPFLFEQYLQAMISLGGEIDPKNPSTFSLIAYLITLIDFFGFLSEQWIFFLSICLYIGILFLIIIIFFYWKTRVWALQKNQFTNSKSQKVLLSLLLIVFGLIIPRFKDYSYNILILPAYYLIRSINNTNPDLPERRKNTFLIFTFLLSSYKFSSIFFLFFLDYNVLISIYILFIAYIYHSYRNFYKSFK